MIVFAYFILALVAFLSAVALYGIAQELLTGRAPRLSTRHARARRLRLVARVRARA